MHRRHAGCLLEFPAEVAFAETPFLRDLIEGDGPREILLDEPNGTEQVCRQITDCQAVLLYGGDGPVDKVAAPPPPKTGPFCRQKIRDVIPELQQVDRLLDVIPRTAP